MRTLIRLSLLFLPFTANSQNFHLTAFGGYANYQGDLQDKRFTTKEAHAAFGGGLLYEFTEKIYLRANITVATVSATDKSDTKNVGRNLSFSSPIRDIHLGLEYDLLNIYDKGFTPYLFAGISYFHFDPSAIDSSGNKIYLQPLGTEGQGFYKDRKKYNLDQFAIPFGAGVKLAVGDNVRVGLEVGMRKTATDYLDDVSSTYADKNDLLLNNGPKAVEMAFRGDELKNGSTYPAAGSQRGGAAKKDWYYFTGITLSWRIHKNESGSGRSSKLGCPSALY